jgi:hypothetical protein
MGEHGDDQATSLFGLYSPSGLTARAIPAAAFERTLFHRARSLSKGMPWL